VAFPPSFTGQWQKAFRRPDILIYLIFKVTINLPGMPAGIIF